MHDSYESPQGWEEAGGAPRWLLFIHRIPAKPDYARVKVRRQLQRLGAVQLKGSVYVLPRSDEALEDFQWLRRLVVEEGGEATVSVASFCEGASDEEIEAMFRTRSDQEYDEIAEAARALEAPPTEGEVKRLERRLARAATRDFYESGRALEAERVVGELAARADGSLSAPDPGLPRDRPPGGSTWVTRRGVQIDRIACAWLVKRFIDPSATFRFVPARGYEPAPGEVLFDMFEGGYTHVGDRCTFEVLVERFVPDDPALRAIAEIVHDVDCKDGKFGAEEAAGVASVVRGIGQAHADDPARLEAGGPLFDGLYAAFRAPGRGRGGG